MSSEAVPLEIVGPGGNSHPGWCSPEHCRATGYATVHESARVEVADLTVRVTQSTAAGDPPTYAVVTMDEDPAIAESGTVIFRLHQVPALAKALLELYCARS